MEQDYVMSENKSTNIFLFYSRGLILRGDYNMPYRIQKKINGQNRAVFGSCGQKTAIFGSGKRFTDKTSAFLSARGQKRRFWLQTLLEQKLIQIRQRLFNFQRLTGFLLFK